MRTSRCSATSPRRCGTRRSAAWARPRRMPSRRASRSSRSSMADAVFVGLPKRFVKVSVDGHELEVLEGATILDACRQLRIDTPTLCQLETLTPVNVCRVCVVELEGSRVLVPACSRKVEAGLKIPADLDRVRHTRRLVLELLASSVDMSLCSAQVE